MARFVQPTFIVDSSARFLRSTAFDSSLFLKGPTYISSPPAAGTVTPYALVVNTLGTDISISSIQLGSMAIESSGTYATNASVNLAFATNASLGYLTAKVISLDACLGPTTVLTYASNASIGNLTTRVNYLDTSLGTNWQLTSAINASTSAYATNTSVNLAFASNASLGYLTAKVISLDACLGPTTVLTYVENTSIGNLTTRVNYLDTSLGTLWTHVPGYVSKYTWSFTPSGNSQVISASTHSLGYGPFTVNVFESTREQVYTGVKFDSSGNITLDWYPGALTLDCSVFITG
jgi:hypothetical protein